MTNTPKAPNERGLRDKIIDATIDVLAESGLYAVTHRVVAGRAGASLGSTTYHFKSLDDLIVAALDRSAERYAQYLDSWVATHRGKPTDTLLHEVALSVYNQSTGEFRAQAVASQQLYSAAFTRPALRLAARRSFSTTVAVMQALFGAQAAAVMTPLLVGITTEILLDEKSYNPESIRVILAAVLASATGTTR